MQDKKNHNAIATLSLKRLQNEAKKVKEKIANNQWPSGVKLTPFIEDESPNLFKWNLVIEGRKGTLFEGGLYRIVLEYHLTVFSPPTATAMDKNFKHIHLYEDGRVCLGMLIEGLWNVDTPLFMIAREIEDLIHREPNLSSPANHKLADIYQKNPEEYERIIKEVARLCK